jgi:pre-mRNA-splicing factor CWC22
MSLTILHSPEDVCPHTSTFEKLFQDQYETVHRLEHVQLRTVTKFFAQLLISNAISWSVCIHF